MLDRLRDEWSKSPTLTEYSADGRILTGMNSAIPGYGPILADHSGVPTPDQAERWYRARATAAYMSATRGKPARDVGTGRDAADGSALPPDVPGNRADGRGPQPAVAHHPASILRSGHQERVVSHGEDHPRAHRRRPVRDDRAARTLVRAGRAAARILDPAPRHPRHRRRLAHPLRAGLDPHHRRQRLPTGTRARGASVPGGRPRPRDGADRPEALPRAEEPAGGDQGAGAALRPGGLRSRLGRAAPRGRGRGGPGGGT